MPIFWLNLGTVVHSAQNYPTEDNHSGHHLIPVALVPRLHDFPIQQRLTDLFQHRGYLLDLDLTEACQCPADPTVAGPTRLAPSAPICKTYVNWLVAPSLTLPKLATTVGVPANIKARVRLTTLSPG
jgi:hypothetical protein